MSLPILDNVRIASPCTVEWSAMTGDDRVRHCGQCDLDVFNLAALTRPEAEALLQSNGRVCAQLYRRFDGTVITQDCPVGWKKARRAVRRRVMLGAIFTLALFGVGAAVAAQQSRCHSSVDDGDAFDSPLLAQLVALFKGQPTQPYVPVAGGIMVPPPTPAPTPIANNNTTPGTP